MSKVVIYTALFGNYETLHDIPHDESKYDLVCFTDNKRIKSKTWDIRLVDKLIDDSDVASTRTARYYKTHPHKLFTKSDISIWVDAAVQKLNFQIVEKFLKQFQDSETNMLLSKHPSRDCLYDEMNACLEWGKGVPDVMKKQIAGYEKEKFPKKFGLVETGLIFRKTKSTDVKKHNEAWWNEIKTKSIRDQLSFNYAMWKTEFKDPGNVFSMFTLQDRLMMVKFTFHGKGYKKKEKVLYAGPWFGEFGWELFGWQGYIRKKVNAEYWDEVVVATRPGHEYLYEDFADRVITSDPPGVRGGPLLDGRAPQFQIKNTSGKDVHVISPSTNLCHRIAIDQKEHEYVTYGAQTDSDIDILIHARNINNAGFDFRNWAESKWIQLVDSLKGKYKIASIGTEAGALHIEGTEDLRGISLKDLSNYMASVKCVVGPSSGPMHLASLSHTKHIVWTDAKASLLGKYTNRQRYESVWNPFKSEVIVIDGEDWNPSVETVYNAVTGEITETVDDSKTVLFVAVFNDKSTNVSQSTALRKAGCDVIEYDYRAKLAELKTPHHRDADLVNLCRNANPDIVIFSKCNDIDYGVVKQCNKVAKTVMWYMDPLTSWAKSLEDKIKLCDYTFCDKQQALEKAKKLTKNAYYLAEGYDADIDKPHKSIKEIRASFIGTLYGRRKEMLDGVDCQIFNNAYGKDHAEIVCQSIINLNVCTDRTASDRIYKIMAAGGFLLTDDWEGRQFEDGKDLVIYKDKDDLKEKIKYYLSHDKERNKIAKTGHKSVQKYTRDNWAKTILEVTNE